MLEDFERLLARHIGLDAESVGRDLITRAVNDRVRATDTGDVEAYWQLVNRSPEELQALIEAVVVVETWFFRDPEAFACVGREANGWLASHASGPYRVLSLPCATGEEPYSIAMALLETGFPAERLAIEGVDISAPALARARQGVYGNNAFRGKDLAFRARYFDPVAGGFRLRDACREGVMFRTGNLLGADLALRAGQYHAIFCRNLLIYLDANAQRQALDVLARLLAAEGLLFVGPSETSLLRHGFSALRVPLAFGFRKQPPDGVLQPVRREARPAPRVVQTTPSPAPARANVRRPAAALEPPGSETKTLTQGAALTADAQLDRAASLADRGLLAEAFGLCADHQRLHGASARCFYLMGLLREAQSRPDEAATLLEKAIYLDPHHRDALTHLALLLERRGDAARAERLRRRAERSATQEDS